jgi:hypothetical protein
MIFQRTTSIKKTLKKSLTLKLGKLKIRLKLRRMHLSRLDVLFYLQKKELKNVLTTNSKNSIIWGFYQMVISQLNKNSERLKLRDNS